MKDRPPKPLFLGLMLTCMILTWTINFIAGKIALRHIPVMALVTGRLELAALVMAGVYFLTPRRTKLDRRDIGMFIVLGILGVVLNQGGFTMGLKYTTVGHSAIIIALAPVMVLLLARIWGLEAISLRKGVGMALCLAGAIALGSENGFGSLGMGTLKGDLITLISVAAYALYAVLGKKVVQKYDTVTMNFFNFLTAAVFLLPLATYEWTRLDWRGVGWAGWAGMAYMAIFSSVVGYMIYYWALRHMEASRLAATTYIEPVLALILGVIILGEHLTGHLFIGGALVLTGVYITERDMGDKVLPPEPV
ncbi:MAG: DMT family transporter [Candidatus Acidiferrales bacterium]